MADDRPEAPAPRPKRRRWLRRTLWIGGGLLVAVVIGVPLLVRSIGPGRIEAALSESFRTEARVRSVSFSWLDGVRLESLRVEQAAGFGEEPALEVASVDAELRWRSLLRGRLDLRAVVDAPVVRVVRDAQGQLNWDQILVQDDAKDPQAPPREPGEPNPEEAEGLSLDLKLRDGLVEFVDRGRDTRHRIHGLQLQASNEDFRPPFVLEALAMVPAREIGQEVPLRITGELDPRAGREGRFQLELPAIDLTPWGELIAAFSGALASLEGGLEGQLEATWTMAEGSSGLSALQLDGELLGSELRAAGGSLGERVLDLPSATIRPALAWDPAEQRLRTDELLVDLGLLELRGAPAREGASDELSLSLRVGLQQLAAHEGLLPSSLQGLAGELDLRIDVDGGAPLLSADFLEQPVVVRLSGSGRDLAWASELLPAALEMPKTLGLELPVQLDLGGESLAMSLADARVGLGSNEIRITSMRLVDDVLETRTRIELDPTTTASVMAAYGPPRTSTTDGLGVDVDLRWPMGQATEDLGALMSAVGFAAQLELPRVRFMENELGRLPLGVQFEGGRLVARAGEGAQLNRGGLELNAQWDPRGEAPLDFRLAWKSGEVGASWTPALRYAVPLMAGLRVDGLDDLASIDFHSGIDLELKLQGPTKMAEEADVLSLLGAWGGTGSLRLDDGSLVPSSHFAQLQEWIGEDRELDFERIETSFDLANGFLSTRQLQYSRGDKSLGFSGRTGLAGELDWKLSMEPWLQRSDRGKEILALMKAPQIPLTGSLSSPSLALPDLQNLLLNSGRDLLDQIGKDPKGTIDALKGIFDRGKRKKDG